MAKVGGMETEVLAFDPAIDEFVNSQASRRATWRVFLGRSDFVSIHVLDLRTRHLIGDRDCIG